uniref:G_PROTEIN_RECEP_F1_2 domain-containing protein n=2 Tax=Bursaphelenchus xylophilus TaxID=6326 RepID=A0A1I7SB89_BURXY
MNATVLCEESEEYRMYLPLRASEAVCLLLAVPAFVLLVYTAASRKERVVTSSLHFNFKLLLYNIWLIVAYQVLFVIFSCCYMLVHSTFWSYRCSNLFTVWQCFLIRGPVLWAIPAMTLAHAAALLERTLATRYSGDYEKRGKSVGITTMIAMWVVGAVIDYNIFAVDNMFGKLAYCDATVSENQERVKKMLTCLLPIELLITAGDIGLWWINRRDQKQTICYTDYTLSKSFQQSENYLTSRLVLPISLVHSSFYMFYLAVTSSFRSSFGYDSDPKAFMVGLSLVNGILTIGLAVCIITYLWCLRKMENDRRLRELEHGSKKNTEIYFKMLNCQIK